MSGHLKIDATLLTSIARTRGWSEERTNNAKRIIDGGMGTNYGFKEYEETSIEDSGMEGFGWVYYLYNERLDELESII
jgi:hypothetical protein